MEELRQPQEENRIPLAEPGEVPFQHSVSLYDGALALYREIRRDEAAVEQHVWTFTKEETKKLFQVLHEHLSNVKDEKQGEQWKILE